MSVYYKGKLISGIREIPHLTQSEYDALTNKPDLWIRTDAPDSDRGIDADDIDYDENNSVKDKIDNIVKAVKFSGTTTASGAMLLPSKAIANYAINVIYDSSYTQRGLVFLRGDGYATCYDNNLQLIANTEVHLIVYYMDRNE